MATSGTVSFSSTRDTIIRDAFRILTLRKLSGILEPEDMENAGRSLNELITSWQAEGFGAWLERDITLHLAYETTSYSIGSAGTNASLTTYKTAIATAASETDTTITVDDDANIADNDYIGIQLDDDTMQWTTVNGTPTSNVVTLDDALTDDVAVDNVVYNYTTKANRPLEIYNAWIRDSSDVDIPVRIGSKWEYNAYTSKTSTGSYPIFMYYDPLMTSGVIHVYPAPTDLTYRLMMTAKVPIDIFSAYGDEPHFPQEWMRALKWNLANDLLPEYADQISGNLIGFLSARIAEKAYETKQIAFAFDNDKNPIRFAPELRY